MGFFDFTFFSAPFPLFLSPTSFPFYPWLPPSSPYFSFVSHFLAFSFFLLRFITPSPLLHSFPSSGLVCILQLSLTPYTPSSSPFLSVPSLLLPLIRTFLLFRLLLLLPLIPLLLSVPPFLSLHFFLSFALHFFWSHFHLLHLPLIPPLFLPI